MKFPAFTNPEEINFQFAKRIADKLISESNENKTLQDIFPLNYALAQRIIRMKSLY